MLLFTGKQAENELNPNFVITSLPATTRSASRGRHGGHARRCLRARFEPLSREDLLCFAEFSITAIRKGGGANDLTAFMDALIASRRQPAELYGRVLQSADLMRVIISHLALVDGGRAARTCKEWRTAWELLMPTKSTFTEAEWYYGVPAFLEGMVWVYDNIDYPVEAMARDVDKDGERLYFFGSKMWRLHATALQL